MLDSIWLLSLSTFSLGVMQYTSLASILSFFVFQSNMRCWLTSFFFSFRCASLYVFDLHFLFISAVATSRCPGRNLFLSSFHLQFRLQSFCGFIHLLRRLSCSLVLRHSSYKSLIAALNLHLVLSFRLDNEAKHFALSRSYQSLVFF